MKYKIKYNFTVAEKGSKFVGKSGECEINTDATEAYLRATNELPDFLARDAEVKLKRPVFNLTITSIEQI